MPRADYFTQCTIKIGGQRVSEEFMDVLVEVVVDSSLHLPDMFTITLNDYGFEWVDSNLLDVGKEVQIKIETGGEQGGLEGDLIKGEITALEPSFSAEGQTTMMIRGYDKSHRLHRGRQTRTFLSQKDDDVVRTIAGDVGLTPDIDTTNVTYDYILQNNQTNLEFLSARAARIGYQVYAAEGRLYFKKGDANLGQGPELNIGDTLDSFRPRLTASQQADTIKVKGWDPKGKQAIEAQATPSRSLNQGGMMRTGGDMAQGAFGAAEAVVTDRPVFIADEATALATGLSHDISRECIQAEGTCQGDPRIKAGWTVTIRGVGRRFSGRYFVTAATHVYSQSGYETTFSISGRQPNTLSHLLAPENGREQGRGLVRGVVTGLVTNLNDPDDLGRVKVKYAWLGEIESDWVRVATPMAGAERGFFYLPEVNDEVLIAFEHGDVHRPYVVGALWSNEDKPPKPNSEVVGDGAVNERIVKSRSGHVVILDDTDGEEQIIIRDKTEKNEIVIDSQNNSMTIRVDGDFVVEAQGKITLKSAQDMALETDANSSLKAGGSWNAEAQGNGTVKGAQLTLEGSAKSVLKAPTVTVEGSALAEVKGGLVKLN